MSAKDQIKQIVDFFQREPQLKDKTDGMAEGLMLGASLADEANERSLETDDAFKRLQQEYTENGNGAQTSAEISVARDGELVLDDRLKRDFGKVNAQLAENETEIAGILVQTKRNMPLEMLEKVKNKIIFPEGWKWTDAPITIYKNGNGSISTDFDVSNFEQVGNGKTYYLSTPANGGSSSNDGLTSTTPKNRLMDILRLGDADVILVDDGYYNFEQGTDQIDIAKNISIKALKGAEGDVTISTNAALAFSKTTGYNNVYNASRTSVGSVFDGEELIEGDMTKLKKMSSVQEVDSTPGSYFYATPNLYIHPLKSRTPDGKIKVFLNIYNLRSTGDYITYTENIKWHGGNNGAAYIATTSPGQNTLFLAKKCEFKYSNAGNGGLTALGCDAYLQDCEVSSNALDGFNYHSKDGRVNKVIEVNCKGFLNGIGRSAWQDNGSTMHDGGSIIRINCDYFKNEGPNVHDVSTGTQSLAVGTQSHRSLADLEARNVNYQIEQGEMWLDTCIGFGSKRAYHVPNEGVLKVRNCLFDDGLKSVTTGTQSNY